MRIFLFAGLGLINSDNIPSWSVLLQRAKRINWKSLKRKLDVKECGIIWLRPNIQEV